MSETKIAIRYAQALMNYANENNLASDYNTQMKNIISVCEKSPELIKVLKNPVIKNSEKWNALSLIFKGFHPQILNLLNMLCNRRREQFLPSIAKSFNQIYNQQAGIIDLTVESAVPVGADTIQSISNFIKSKTGASLVNVNNEINQSVMGGLLIKFGDNLIDTTITSQLKKLKKELNIA